MLSCLWQTLCLNTCLDGFSLMYLEGKGEGSCDQHQSSSSRCFMDGQSPSFRSIVPASAFFCLGYQPSPLRVLFLGTTCRLSYTGWRKSCKCFFKMKCGVICLTLLSEILNSWPHMFFFSKCAVSLGHGLLTRNVLIFFVRPVCTFVISWQTTGLCEKLNVSMDLKRSNIRGLNISSYDL